MPCGKVGSCFHEHLTLFGVSELNYYIKLHKESFRKMLQSTNSSKVARLVLIPWTIMMIISMTIIHLILKLEKQVTEEKI